MLDKRRYPAIDGWMWEKPTGRRESCWCRVTKSVGRGPSQTVAGQMFYSVRERNAAKLRTRLPRRAHVSYITEEYEGRTNVIMDSGELRSTLLVPWSLTPLVLSGTFNSKHLNPNGGHRPIGKQIPVDVLIEICGILGGPDWN